MSDSVALIIISPTARLGREISSERFPEPIRLRSLDGLRRKLEKHPAAFLLFEWNLIDGESTLRILNSLRRDFSSFRFAVFCPNLSEQPLTEAEAARFLLLENGATAVFANRRELASLSEIVRKHFDEHPQPAKDRIRAIRETF